MTFKIDGFLSPGMKDFRSSLRDIPTFKLWLDFTATLNRLGHEMLDGHDTPLSDNQKLTITALFVRSHKSLQSALILSESGLIGDARSVLRTAVEGAIAIRALAAEPRFFDQLIEAHYVNQRKKARIVLENPDYVSLCSAQEIADMQATVAQIDAMENTKGRKLADIIWANVGIKYSKELYELIYRLLSSDGTHTTVDAIDRMFIKDPKTGHLTEIKVGPDTDKLVDTLKAGCLMFLWAADSFATTYGQTSVLARIQERMQVFETLPRQEPAGAVVEAHF